MVKPREADPTTCTANDVNDDVSSSSSQQVVPDPTNTINFNSNHNIHITHKATASICNSIFLASVLLWALYTAALLLAASHRTNAIYAILLLAFLAASAAWYCCILPLLIASRRTADAV